MSRNFEEQVVLITGAGAGIGQAAALAFADLPDDAIIEL